MAAFTRGPALNNYLDTVREVYARAAAEPDEGLCCVDGALRRLPGLAVPERMLEMNYGCGSTVEPDDLAGQDPVLYIGVGGGLEALQLAWFRRRPGGVIGVDPVPEMRQEAARNLEEAARQNDWFRPEFVTLVDGSASALPVPDGSIGVVAQNCLFNVLERDDLEAALREVRRVLVPGGRFVTSDPIATRPIPESLRRNTTLRARCVAGCVSFENYTAALLDAGFREVLVRARRPYRLLLPSEHPEIAEPILLESIDAVARSTEGLDGEPRLFTGRTAIYLGPEAAADAAGFAFTGFAFKRGVPASVSDAAARGLALRDDFLVTPPTYNVRTSGCC